MYIYGLLVCSRHPESPKWIRGVRGAEPPGRGGSGGRQPTAAEGLRGGSPPGKAHIHIALTLEYWPYTRSY